MSENRINLINGVYSPPRPPLKPSKPRRSRKKTRFIVRVLILILAVIILFSTNIIFSHNSLITNLGRLSFWEGVARLMVGKDKILKGELSDRINILILGMGGAEHEGPYLTDTIILAGLKPSTSQLGLLSIPRDLYVPVPGHGWQKINAANSLGMIKSNDGGKLTSKVVEKILDLDVHYWVRIDFNIFKEIIDELGGIEIDVEKSFTDYQFPGPEFSYRAVSFEAGKQIMDGEKALQFARSRHGNNYEGSDFARARRQQKILFAIKYKIEQENLLSQPTKIWRLYNIFKNNISTNIDLSQGVKLAKLISEVNENNIITKVIEQGENGPLKAEISINGAYILRPKTGNFKDLAAIAREILKQPPVHEQIVFGQRASGLAEQNLHQTPINPKIIILNGTYITGLARQTSEELKNNDFDVIKIGNAPVRNYKKTIIYQTSEHANQLELEKLQNILIAEINNEFSQELKNIALNNGADFLIILGNE